MGYDKKDQTPQNVINLCLWLKLGGRGTLCTHLCVCVWCPFIPRQTIYVCISGSCWISAMKSWLWPFEIHDRRIFFPSFPLHNAPQWVSCLKKRKKRKGGTNLKLVRLLGEQSALQSLDEVVYSKEQTDEVEDIIGREKWRRCRRVKKQIEAFL